MRDGGGQAVPNVPSPGTADPGANGGRGNGANGRPSNGLAASSLRHDLLVQLREAGPTSPDGLAAALGASRTGVLQQLHALEEAGLVWHAAEKHGVGRPRHLYDLTPDAQELFPSDYGGFAVGLLAAVEAVGGPSLVDEVFAARRRQIGERVRARMAETTTASAPLAERVRALAAIQNQAGYLADAVVDADGTLRLRERNCAIFQVASHNRAACDAELALFREVLDAEVVRESHIAAGDRCCSYRVTAAD